MKHRHAEYIIAFANGEKVTRTLSGVLHPVICLNDFEFFKDWEFRLAPKTMRIGSRDVPVPSLTSGVHGLSCTHQAQPLLFKTEDDRTEFWDALVAAVKEAS